MNIPKQVIVAHLRARDQHARADWVDRDLPEDIDPARHVGLFATLRLNVDDLVKESNS